MSDSSAVEAIAVQFAIEAAWTFYDVQAPDPGPKARTAAAGILAALRAAGFEIYRPDECHPIVIDNEIGVERGPWRMVVNWNVGEAHLETDLPDGTYRLVPVGGED